jgi:hypothetical protein
MALGGRDSGGGSVRCVCPCCYMESGWNFSAVDAALTCRGPVTMASVWPTTIRVATLGGQMTVGYGETSFG